MACRARKELAGIFSKVIQGRRAAGRSEHDLLQHFMDSRYKVAYGGRATNDEEISGMLIASLFAGQHTSSITSAWTGYFMLADKVPQSGPPPPLPPPLSRPAARNWAPNNIYMHIDKESDKFSHAALLASVGGWEGHSWIGDCMLADKATAAFVCVNVSCLMRFESCRRSSLASLDASIQSIECHHQGISNVFQHHCWMSISSNDGPGTP